MKRVRRKRSQQSLKRINLLNKVSYLFYNQNIELTEEQIELLSLIEVVKKKRNEFLDECEILKSEYEKNTTETGILIENKIVAKENIALEKELLVE